MSDPIELGRLRYYPCKGLTQNGRSLEIAKDVQKRQSFVSSKKLKLDRTSGAFMRLGDQIVAFVIDRRTIGPNSPEWDFIGAVGVHLEACWAALSDEARAALKDLKAVVFSAAPVRAYADVKPGAFIYDTDEFRRDGGSFISAAYAASNIVHDANHIRMFNAKENYAGLAAERTCWRLQVANAEALGMDSWEVEFLEGLIEDPRVMEARIGQNPLSEEVVYKCPTGACRTASA